jgi:hypothetical protein
MGMFFKKKFKPIGIFATMGLPWRCVWSDLTEKIRTIPSSPRKHNEGLLAGKAGMAFDFLGIQFKERLWLKLTHFLS